MIRAEFRETVAEGSSSSDPKAIGIWVKAVVEIPKFQSIGVVEFIVDTGAETTCLDMAHARLLVPELSLKDGDRMVDPRHLEGIGGSSRYYPEYALIAFQHEEGDTEVFSTIVDIPVATESNWEHTLGGSLLGMDVLSRYALHLDYSRKRALLADPGQALAQLLAQSPLDP